MAEQQQSQAQSDAENVEQTEQAGQTEKVEQAESEVDSEAKSTADSQIESSSEAIESEQQPELQETSVAAKTEDELDSDAGDDSQKGVDYPGWLNTFQGWLGKTGDKEVRNLADFFDRSKQWWEAAKELTADEFNTASTYLKRDLMMFYRHYQQDLDDSPFVQSVKESMWRELAEMTDKSQIEWQELKKDFDHDGVYQAGEWIGMGIIVCKSCHYHMEFAHPEELSPCPNCGGTSFLREALAP